MVVIKADEAQFEGLGGTQGDAAQRIYHSQVNIACILKFYYDDRGLLSTPVSTTYSNPSCSAMWSV